MQLPVNPPLLPMLAKRIADIPIGDYLFEPKWDGFRALIFRDGEEVLIQSRDQKSLNRYFPELIPPLLAALPQRAVLDGEIVIARNGKLDFEALQLRVHPAASRVLLLSQQTPASIVFFDLLCEGDRSFCDAPLRERRARLEAMLAGAAPPIHLTPSTEDTSIAQDWFRRFEGAGLDGVMAKPLTGTYEPNKRATYKVKHERDCDCVVAGFRWYKKDDRPAIGSLLLGLFDHAGALHHVGVCASFSLEKRIELVEFLAAYRENALTNHPWAAWAETLPLGEDQRMPGGKSRWNQDKDLGWEPLRPELVVEVAYEHMQGMRFRHMAQFRRWRTDKPVLDCNYAQLEVVAPQELMAIFPEIAKQ